MALGLLDVVHHAVAAGKGVLQLDLDQRQSVTSLGDLVKKDLRIAEAQFMPRKRVLVGQDVLDVALGRTPAVVADAVKAHRVPDLPDQPSRSRA